MPITRTDIVKAKFLYDVIIIAILMLLFCIRLVMSAHIYKDLAIMLGLLSACLILSSYYSFMFFKWRERIDSVDLYIGMILAAVIALAHTVFYWIEVPTFDFALLFIIPIITSYICYMFYKKSVHYMTV